MWHSVCLRVPSVDAPHRNRRRWELWGIGALLLGLALPASAHAGPATPPRAAVAAAAAAASNANVPGTGSGRYGAQPPGVVSYPVPAGAYFVSPSGNDAAAGNSTAPWRTVGKAVSAAPSGATIVLRKGTYHQSAAWTGKRLTLQPYPGELVVFDGSVPVTKWVADSASLWHADNWTARFKQGGRPDLIVKSYPYAAYPDMAFRDGVPLRQVGSQSAVVAGTFYPDYTNQRLYVGSSPVGHLMAGSTLSRALYINYGNGSVIQGLVFQRYANHPDLLGAVLGSGSGLVFDNDVFQYNAAIGLSDLADNSKVTNSTFDYNGQMGLHSHSADNVVIQGNWMHHNNTETFMLAGAQGGLKVTRGSNQLWADNLSEYNYGDGLWADNKSSYITIVRNVVRYNTFRGIKGEVSGHIIVASNLVVGNATYGILNNESADYRVWNNTLIGNGRGIEATDFTRHSTDPTFPLDVKAMPIRNNIIVDAGTGWGRVPALLVIDDYTRTRTAAQMGVTADYNAYYRTTIGQPTYISWWPAYPTPGNIQSPDMATFRRLTGQETHGIAGDGIPAPFVDPAAGNYRVKPGSKPALAGTPLPANIAAAIGVPAGVRVDMGILQ